jgi:hypothetical protein
MSEDPAPSLTLAAKPPNATTPAPTRSYAVLSVRTKEGRIVKTSERISIGDDATVTLEVEASPVGSSISVDGRPQPSGTLAPSLSAAVLYQAIPLTIAERDAFGSKLHGKELATVEVSSRGKAARFTIALEELDCAADCLAALVNAAAKIPVVARGSSKSVVAVGARIPDYDRGVGVVGARGVTFGSFDDVATEEILEQKEAKTCDYDTGPPAPLVVARTRWVVRSRDGTELAKKEFPFEATADCPAQRFVIDGKAPPLAAFIRPNPYPWLDSLAKDGKL